MVSLPGSVALKQNTAWPPASVVAEPLAGLACVVTAVGTVKRTVAPGTGLLAASFTVAVTQCGAPTVFVAVAGESVSVAGAPAVQVFVAVPLGSPASWTPLLLV